MATVPWLLLTAAWTTSSRAIVAPPCAVPTALSSCGPTVIAARAYPGRTCSRTMPRRSASGSAGHRANSAGATSAPSSGAGSAMIRGYGFRVPPPPHAMTPALLGSPRAVASATRPSAPRPPRPYPVPPQRAEYVRASSEAPDDVVADLLAETAAMADRGEVPPTFQIPPEQGIFMQLLTRALGVRRAIEIGTFTGFSALCVARGLPDDGRLLCLDTNAEWTAIARRYWERAGVSERIELRLGDAHE